MTIWGVIGIILLCIIAIPVVIFFLVLLICSFKTRVCFKITPEEKEISISHLFFKTRVYPLPPKKDENEKTKKIKKEPAEKKRSVRKGNSSVGEYVMARIKALVIPDYIEFIRLFKDKFIKRIKFEKLFLQVKVASPSADVTAQRYGQLNAAVFPLLGKLHSAGKIKDGEVRIRPDFSSENTEVWADVDVSVRIINIFSWAIHVVFKILTKKLS